MNGILNALYEALNTPEGKQAISALASLALAAIVRNVERGKLIQSHQAEIDAIKDALKNK